MHNNSIENIKIGFIGYGRYGYSLMRGIIDSNFNLESLYFQKIKQHEIAGLSPLIKKRVWSNYSVIKKKAKNNNFIQLDELPVITNVLIISLSVSDIKSFLNLFKKKGLIGNFWKDKWIVSVIPRFKVEDYRKELGFKVNVIRIMPNLSTRVKQGIIAVYVDCNNKKEGNALAYKLFNKLALISYVKNEILLDLERVTTGSLLGLSAYFLNLIQQSIMQFGKTDKESFDLIIKTLEGLLALQKETSFTLPEIIKEISLWKENSITYSIIKELRDRNIEGTISESLSKVYDNYKQRL